MTKFKYHIVALSLALMLMAPMAQVQAATTTTPTIDRESLIERIRGLVAELLALRSKMSEVQAEIKEEIRVGLSEGMTGDDIKKVQGILATDKDIYPEGMVTGYFGPLTKNALRRFQQKFELKVTGEIDADTRAYLEELLKERFGENIPAGLLTAPGIRNKIELRIKDGCDDDARGAGPLCIKFKSEDDDGDDEDEDESEDEDEDESEDEDENEDEDNEEADDATDKIDDAKEAIDDLKEALDDADESDNGYDEATDKLDEAEDYLAEAESAYDDEDYDEAKDKADKAESAADEGEDELDD